MSEEGSITVDPDGAGPLPAITLHLSGRWAYLLLLAAFGLGMLVGHLTAGLL